MGSVDQMASLAESDFDTEPVLLYMALQDKNWSEAMAILERTPQEARTWVFRKAAQGPGVRWRLLPIHGAIIFQAPPEVVESLLLVFPEGASYKDDEGSLPIHLAYKRASSEPICKLLLNASPGCIDVADRKGRTPKTLATSSTGQKHREFVSAIKNHLLAVQAARVAACAEDRSKFDQQLDEKNKELRLAQQRSADLEKELWRTQEASQVLVSHVNDLEEQLAKKEQSEKHLQVKVETLEDDLETAFQGKDEYQNEMQNQMSQLNEQLTSFQDQVNQLLLEKDVLNESLDQVVTAAEMEKKDLVEANAALEEEISRLRDENDRALSDSILFKAEIKERSDKLKVMEKHAEISQDKADVSKSQFEEVKEERNMLRATVKELNEKLRKVDSCLEEMKREQEAIVEEAELHEEEMLEATLEHARILEEVERQQARDVEAQQDRDQIDAMIRVQEECYTKNTEGRKHIVDSIDLHTKKTAEDGSRNKKMVKSVKALKEKIEKTRVRVATQMPATASVAAQEERQGVDDGNEKSTIDEEIREEMGEISNDTKMPRETWAPSPKFDFTKNQNVFEEEKKVEDEDERDAPPPTGPTHQDSSRLLYAFV